MNHVNADIAIRRNRVHNIDMDRLFRRRRFLIGMLIFNGGRALPTRMDFAMRSAELHAIESELIRRGHLPASMRAAQVHGGHGGML